MTIGRLEALADLEGDLLPAATIALPNPLVATNLTAGRHAVFRHRLLTANCARYFRQPAAALYRYRPGTVVDAEGFEPYATFTEGCLVRQQVPDWVEDADRLAADLAARGRGAPRVQAPCLLAARYGDVTWGHWFFEMLAKIVLAEAAEPKRFTFVVSSRTTRPGTAVPPRYVEAVLQSLQAYGIEAHRLLRIPRGQAVSFDALFDIAGIYPVPGEEFFGPHPGLMAAMAAGVRGVPRGALPARPYIMRSAGDLRQVIDHDALRDRICRHGYNAVDLADLDFGQQVSLFREASSMAGALGSGLAGMIFAPPALKLLTVAPADWPDHYFANIFQKKACLHADIRGESDLSVRGNVARSPFRVKLDDVDAGLEALQSGATLRPDIGGVVLGDNVLPRALGAERFAIDFAASGNAGAFTRSGWSGAEAAHTWSVGEACELSVPGDVLGADDLWLEALGFCFSAPRLDPLKSLCCVVNGVRLAEQWVEGHSRPMWFVPGEFVARRKRVSIRFLHPVSPSPRSLGVSDDDRGLGFGFERVTFFATAPSAPAHG